VRSEHESRLREGSSEALPRRREHSAGEIIALRSAAVPAAREPAVAGPPASQVLEDGEGSAS
jgi:hypothetical protein